MTNLAMQALTLLKELVNLQIETLKSNRRIEHKLEQIKNELEIL